MATDKFNYIEKAYSISKADYFEPWKIEYSHPLDVNKKVTVYLENIYYAAGSTFKDYPVITAGKELAYILDDIFIRLVDHYPYQWPLEGQKIDPNGYDFKTDFNSSGITTGIEIVQSAQTIVWEKCNISNPSPVYETDLTKEEKVSGSFLTKFSILLGKAGPISSIALNLHTTKPMQLLSLVYESDTTTYQNAKKINLDHVNVYQDSYSMAIKLAVPIFARRLTFVLAQNNAIQNSYQTINYLSEAVLYGVNLDSEKQEDTTISQQWGTAEKVNSLLVDKQNFSQTITSTYNPNVQSKQTTAYSGSVADVVAIHNGQVATKEVF